MGPADSQALTRSSRADQARGSKTKKRVTDNKCVPLVLTPLLTWLWLFGYPVPQFCTHQTPVRKEGSSAFIKRKLQDNAGHVDGTGQKLVFKKTGKVKEHARPGGRIDDDDVTLCKQMYPEEDRVPKQEKTPKSTQPNADTFNDMVPDILQDDTYDKTIQSTAVLDQERHVQQWQQQTRARGRGNLAAQNDQDTDQHTETQSPEKLGRKSLYIPKSQACSPCRRKRVLGRTIFAFNVTVFVVNAGRYATIFFNVTSITGDVMLSVITMIFFLCTLFVYVGSYRPVSTHLPKLVRLLQIYDRAYTASLDYLRTRKKVIVGGCVLFACEAVMSIVLAVGTLTFLPSFRRHMTPFDQLEGLGLYAASAVYAFVMWTIAGTFSSLSLCFHISCHMLIAEFSAVAQQFEDLFESCEDSLAKKLNFTSFGSSDHHLPESKWTCHRLVSKLMTKSKCSTVKPSSEHALESGSCTRRCRGNQAPEGTLRSRHSDDISKHDFVGELEEHHGFTCETEPPHRRPAREDNQHPPPSPCMCEESVLTGDRNEHVSSVKFAEDTSSAFKPVCTPQHFTEVCVGDRKDTKNPQRIEESSLDQLKRVKEGSTEASHRIIREHADAHRKSPGTTHHNVDPEDALDENVQDPQHTQAVQLAHGSLLQDSGDAFHKTRADHRKQTGQDDESEEESQDVSDTSDTLDVQSVGRIGHHEDSDEQYVEAAFDRLVAKHQVLCAILQHSKGCLLHLVASPFVIGVPMFCVVIYGLGSSRLNTDETLFLVFVVLQTLAAMLNTTVMGIRLNHSAHRPRDVIYAAEWSAFSDRLLSKVHMLANSLGHTQIGYDAYGLFMIDRSTVLMVVGTLATYTVVVIQFRQAEITTTGNNSTTAA